MTEIDILVGAFRQAGRTLRHRPLSAAVMAVTLAFGVGATTAMIGPITALVFQPPPHVRDPSAVVNVEECVNYVHFVGLARQTRTLDLAGYTHTELSAGVGPYAAVVPVLCVTSSYFGVLGTEAQIGRTFTPEQDSRTTLPTVVLGHEFWHRQFGGVSDVIGKTVTLADRVHSVIGVAPAGFRGVSQLPVDAWVLLTAVPEACTFSGRNLLFESSGAWLNTIGRIRKGVTIAEAQTEIQSLVSAPGGAARDRGRIRLPLSLVHDPRTNRTSRDARTAQWLAGGAAVLFLVACFNVAGLLSIRTAQRRSEIGLRFQLGATRVAVFVHLLAENLWIVFLCCIPAMFVAAWTGRLVGQFLPPSAAHFTLGVRTAGVTAVLGLLAGILTAIPPAMQGSCFDLAPTIAGRGACLPAPSRVRQVLLAGQLVLAFTLMVAASLFSRSLGNLRHNPGFDAEYVVVATVGPRAIHAKPIADRISVMTQMRERVAHLPVVRYASLSSGPVLRSAHSTTEALVQASASSSAVAVECHGVSTEYFATVGTRILQGRAFTAADDASSEAVVVVSLGLASKLWPGEEAVGRCLLTSQLPCAHVVGVSETRRYSALSDVGDELFVPFARLTSYGLDPVPRTLLVRTTISPDRAIGPIARVLGGIGPGLPAVQIRPLADLVDAETRSWRFGATIFTFFGMLATILAGIGVYGSVAVAVGQRIPELAVRMALGATSRDVTRVVFRGAWRLLAISVPLGCVAAMTLNRFISSLLFQVSPIESPSYLAASLVVGLGGSMGCLVPTIRAARADPATLWRKE